MAIVEITWSTSFIAFNSVNDKEGDVLPILLTALVTMVEDNSVIVYSYEPL